MFCSIETTSTYEITLTSKLIRRMSYLMMWDSDYPDIFLLFLCGKQRSYTRVVNLLWFLFGFSKIESKCRTIIHFIGDCQKYQRYSFKSFYFQTVSFRTGLKAMQPMQLHWAPRLWGPAPLGPRAMVFG